MPTSPRETLLSRYRYDPLDRSVEWATDQQNSIQRFYCKSRLTTEIQGTAKYSLLQHDDQVLAQQRQMGDKVDSTLLATDQQRSVINALDGTQNHPLTYTPYGHHPLGNGLLSLLGFNGERPDPLTGHYHLGNGYRQYNPMLMRFNSPDSWSPFGKGGVNAYGYCGGDSINRTDRTGHFPNPIKGLLNFFGRTPSSISAEIKLMKSDLKTGIKIQKNQLRKNNELLKLGNKALTEEALLSKPTKTNLPLSSLGDSHQRPPEYEAPPSYQYADITQKILILKSEMDSPQISDNLIKDNKSYLKQLKYQRKNGVRNLEDALSNLRAGK
nr:RHS repeat-associated core domain-containing protein [uncultured Pseudomonas sp.]